jgi:predicted nucleic acid-binding protein
MSLVVDATILAAWALSPGEDLAGRALDAAASGGVHAPRLAWYELRQTLLAAERAEHIDPIATGAFLSDLDELGIAFDAQAREREVMRLARRGGMTLSAAIHVELAARLSLPLASLDESLLLAAEGEGVARFR